MAIGNPVVSEVKITDGMVQTRETDGHGIGLLNVKTVVDKYKGDMAITCDNREFKVVIII